MNNGRKILFWHDHWGSNCPLKYVFPDLYSVAKNGKCTLQKLVGIYLVNGKTYFEHHFFNFRPISGSEVARFYGLLNSVQFNESDDEVLWYFTSSAVFSVKSCYTILNDGGHRSLFNRSIWKNAAPLKVKVFAWLTCHDKILSRDNLQKRGWTGSVSCNICSYSIESFHHILLPCNVSRVIWDFFLSSANDLFFILSMSFNSNFGFLSNLEESYYTIFCILDGGIYNQLFFTL